MTFEEYVALKTREAEEASIRGFATEFDHASTDLTPIGNEWTRWAFDGDFYVSRAPASRRPACSLVFVQSRDGNTGASDPSILGGGLTDKHLIYEGLSRVNADGVLAGAETVRGGGVVFSVWHPEIVRLRKSLGKPRHPVQIVATLRGLDVETGLLFNAPQVPVIIITVGACARLMSASCHSRPWISTIVMNRPEDLPSAFEALRERGIDRVSAVGGRKLARQMIDAGLVQELYLTSSPRAGGEPGTPLYPRPLSGDVVARKRGIASETGVIFEHLVRLKPDSTYEPTIS